MAATPVAALAFSNVALGNGAEDGADSGNIEEVIVTGRFISSSQQLVNERMNDAFSTDLLGADTIARLGDSTVGAALRRVPQSKPYHGMHDFQQIFEREWRTV